MKILHSIPGMNIYSGGHAQSTYDLVKGLLNAEVQTVILTLESKFNYRKYSDENFIIVAGEPINNRFGYSRFFKENLNQYSEFDLFHIHALWQYTSHISSKFAFKNSIPYIISPKGMLEPWSLNTSNYAKKLALKLYQQKDLEKATCIHATSEMESQNIRNLGLNNPIAVIPHCIDLSTISLRERKLEKDKYKILFLSRIHPKKGIELLIDAYADLASTLRYNWQVQIVGNGNANYIKALMHRIKKRGLENEIKISDPQFGSDKLKTLQEADVFVLPTYSENFGVVIAEALSCGIPVITTKGTPWEELNTYNAGWWIDIGVNPLVDALSKALELTDEERIQMGRNGRKLIEQKYSVETVTEKMIKLYKWILEGGKKPEFVEIT